MVGLDRPDGDEHVGTGRDRVAHEELELAGLVAAALEPGEVVAFDPQRRSVERPTEVVESVDRGGEQREGGAWPPVQRGTQLADPVGVGHRSRPAIARSSMPSPVERKNRVRVVSTVAPPISSVRSATIVAGSQPATAARTISPAVTGAVAR